MSTNKDSSLLGAILQKKHGLTLAQLQQALDMQKETGHQLGDVLIHLGYVTKNQVLHSLADQQRMRSRRQTSMS